ncbi:MAG: hypothetical protein L6R42_005488 [Xanthoria sp. 1 TBL-2021]|nr:MAG: hypothetical protein L6R42_005488 [Xanthoria sp. 1 TBL-2021]
MDMSALSSQFLRIMKETDKNDLIIFYYVGSAIKKDVSPYISRPCTLLSNTQANQRVNLSEGKRYGLDDADADVLYLLDCSYCADSKETASGIGPGKELIAASTVVGGVCGTPGAFTSALVHELTSAYLRVLLSVHLTSHDGIEPILRYLKDWWSSRLPANNSDTGVSFKYATAASKSSGIFVFTMSVAAYYCLQSHAAIRFIGYVGTTEAVWRLEELKQLEQEEPVVWGRKEWEQWEQEQQGQHEAQGQQEVQRHPAKQGKETGDDERYMAFNLGMGVR